MLSNNNPNQDVIDEIQDIAAELGISLDGVNVYHAPSRSSDVVQAYKRIQKNGEKEKYGFEIEITDNFRQQRQQSSIDVFRQKAESALRSMKDGISDTWEVNGHDLSFRTDDGFTAETIPTGEEWSISIDDQYYLPTSFETIGEGEHFPIPDFDDRALDAIPEHIKEKMMFYVAGWALQHDPYEWMDFIRNMDDETIERFK